MQTNLSTTTTGTGAATSALTAAAGGTPSNLFTTLLVAQIRNQNPLDPADPSQFVNQLTQLSQMEALQKLADIGQSNAGMLQSMQVLALGAQVGSQVAARSDSVVLDGTPVPMGFTLQGTSAQTTLVLTGADGREQRVPLGTRAAGDVRFALDPAALGLASGRYAMRVETDAKDNPAIEVYGDLESVKLSAGGSVALTVAHLGEVAPNAITQFNGRQAAAH